MVNKRLPFCNGLEKHAISLKGSGKIGELKHPELGWTRVDLGGMLKVIASSLM